MPAPSRATQNKIETKYNVTTSGFPNYRLHCAASTGDIGLVRYALDHGQPINSVLDGVLPLHAACASGSVQVVKLLIDHGADVNAPRLPRRYSNDRNRDSSTPRVGTSGSTPLHFAAANGFIDIIRYLLLHGAHPDIPDKHGVTPEALALDQGQIQCANVLRDWVVNKDRDLREREGPNPSPRSCSVLGFATSRQQDHEYGPRRRLQMKHSFDNALSILKASSIGLSDAQHKARAATPTTPTSPAKFFEYAVGLPKDDSADFDQSDSVGARRPSLPHLYHLPDGDTDGDYDGSLASNNGMALRRPRSSVNMRRSHSSGSDAETMEPASVYPMYGQSGAGRKLSSKYSLMNIFKKGQVQDGHSPSQSTSLSHGHDNAGTTHTLQRQLSSGLRTSFTVSPGGTSANDAQETTTECLGRGTVPDSESARSWSPLESPTTAGTSVLRGATLGSNSELSTGTSARPGILKAHARCSSSGTKHIQSSPTARVLRFDATEGDRGNLKVEADGVEKTGDDGNGTSMQRGEDDSSRCIPARLLREAMTSPSTTSLLTTIIGETENSHAVQAAFLFNVNSPPTLPSGGKQSPLSTHNTNLQQQRSRGESLSSISTSGSRNDSAQGLDASYSNDTTTNSNGLLRAMISNITTSEPENENSQQGNHKATKIFYSPVNVNEEKTEAGDVHLSLCSTSPPATRMSSLTRSNVISIPLSPNEYNSKSPLVSCGAQDMAIHGIFSRAQAEALVARARQDVLEMAAIPDGQTHASLSVKLAMVGESLALERRLAAQEREAEVADGVRSHQVDEGERKSENHNVECGHRYGFTPGHSEGLSTALKWAAGRSSVSAKKPDGPSYSACIERQLSLENKTGKERLHGTRRPSTAEGISTQQTNHSFPSETSGRSHQSTRSASGFAYTTYGSDTIDSDPCNDTQSIFAERSVPGGMKDAGETDLEILSRIDSMDGRESEREGDDYSMPIRERNMEMGLTSYGAKIESEGGRDSGIFSSGTGRRGEKTRNTKKLSKMGFPTTEQAQAHGLARGVHGTGLGFLKSLVTPWRKS